MTGIDTVAGATEPAVARVLDIELTDPVPSIPRVDAAGQDCAQAWILVRLCGEPLGFEVVAIPPGGLPALELEYLLASKWGDRVRELETGGGTAFSAAHARHLSRAPRVSVVVCTRERPDALAVCLASLTRQDHPDFAVWVIDNAPVTGATREVVESFGDQLEIHYAVEPIAGLSRARNCALRQPLAGDIVAWIDDDEVADPMWLSELTRALADRPAAAAVSGLVVPAELATRAQLWFEQFGGHSKGRGFTPADFGAGTGDAQSPLYPLPPFGVGANMAFRTDALRAAGGFDEALGAGTLTSGAEDTKIFTELLRAGRTSLYRPAAVTRHYHRRDLAGLRKQMHGYGSGLTAFYTSLVLDDPRVIWPLLRLSRQAMRDMTSDTSLRVSGLEDDFPAELLAANRRGMLSGPTRYLRQRVADGRLRRRGRPSRAPISVPTVGDTAPAAWQPTKIVQFDLDHPTADVGLVDADASVFASALLVVRRGVRPVALLTTPIAVAIDPHQREAAVRAALLRTGLEPASDEAGVANAVSDSVLPTVTVVIPSIFERLDELDRCIAGLAGLDYPHFDVVVVDNRPDETRDETMWAPLLRHDRVRVVAEPRAGISAARNRGVAVATGEIIAFTDDDVHVDPRWLGAIGERFVTEPELDGVGGLVLPQELDTEAQEIFERHTGALDKILMPETSRIARPEAGIFRASRYQVDVTRSGRSARVHSVYQLGSIMGANMAFRASALRELGPFDESLGTGTPSRGGEDVDMVVRLLFAGRAIGYEPAAINYHIHRRTHAELARQMRGYGSGFTALLTALVMRDRRHLVGLALAGVPVARAHLSPRPSGVTTIHEGLSPDLRRQRQRGMLEGPAAYLRRHRRGVR